jgi:ABC-2 type transport system ATP-binding protein
VESFIAASGLSKSFGDLRAVDGISLNVGAGILFGLIGPNGAGKTTVIRCLTGQSNADSGRMSVLGVNPGSDPVGVKRVVGIIPEQEAPPSFLTGGEYLDFVAEIRGLGDVSAKVMEWAKRLDFSGQLNVLCKDMSRGNRQKLMITQAFLHNPRVVFIDEPLVNLDPIAQKRMKDFLKEYVRGGNSVFLCTHILEIVEELCGRIAILKKGRVVAEGTIEDISGGGHLEEAFMKLMV